MSKAVAVNCTQIKLPKNLQPHTTQDQAKENTTPTILHSNTLDLFFKTKFEVKRKLAIAHLIAFNNPRITNRSIFLSETYIMLVLNIILTWYFNKFEYKCCWKYS